MDDLRTIECRLAGSVQKVEVADVLVNGGALYLVVANSAGQQWVLEVPPKGIRHPNSDVAKEVLGLHQQEMLRFQRAVSNA